MYIFFTGKNVHENSSDCEITIQSEYEGDTSSLLSSQKQMNSEEESNMRQYKYRKLDHLVRKCHDKNIKFDKKYVNLSYQYSTAKEGMTFTELEELRSECQYALGTDYSSDSSSSNSTQEKKCTQRKKKGKQHYLYSSAQSENSTPNPYNISSLTQFMYATSPGTRPIYQPQSHLSNFQFGMQCETSPNFSFDHEATSRTSLPSFPSFGLPVQCGFNYTHPSLSCSSTPSISPAYSPSESPLLTVSDVSSEVCNHKQSQRIQIVKESTNHRLLLFLQFFL